MAFLPLFSLFISLSPMFTRPAGAASTDTIDGMARAWLFMSAVQRGELADNKPLGWLNDFAVIGLDDIGGQTLGAPAKYRCGTGYVGHMVSSGDGKAHANYDFGGAASILSPCRGTDNRNGLFGPIAASMGYDSGVKFFERVGYVKAVDGSGNYANTKGKSQLDSILREKWGNDLPYENLGSGLTPKFIKYDILVSALRDQCIPSDSSGLFANPKGPNESGGDILTLVDNSGAVGRFAVKTDDGRNVTVGLNVHAGENGSGQLSCGQIKGALMNADLANDYAAQLKVADPSTPGSGTQSINPGDKKSSCSIDGIGWIVCPVMRFMAKIVDQTYGIVSGMLTVNPISTDTGSPLYTAWATMRSFANVAFVIVFLIIIYSQLTSVGISNYNIKKMLPRLIVAAILVNVSYWLCAIAVDISNIVGQSAKSLLENIPVITAGGQSNANTGAGGAWDLLTVAAIAGVTFAIVDVAVLLPMLVMAVFAIVTVILVLIMRQALIVILIVISPLAFVAYLLPNTESLFKKWMDLFKVLLLMFPIIAIIFGGSRLASAIITQATNDPSNKDTNFLLQAMAAGVTIIPLFLTPVVMKAAGGLLNRFGGIINNPNKGPFDRMRKGAEGIRDRRKEANLMNALDPEKRSMLGRGAYSRFKDRRSRTHKAGMAGYENRLQSQWANSQAGQAATDALKGTELQTEIDKAAADVRYKTTGDLDLQLKARLGKMDVDAYQAEQDALLKEISSTEGASKVTGVSDQLKLQAQHAAQDKNINDLRAGSAERVMQQEQAANIQNLTTGQAQYAGGVDTYGTQRVIASAIAQKKKARLENVQSEQSTMTEASSRDLVAMMNNGGATIERREAATGLLAQRGSDTDIHAALDTLASMDLRDVNTTALQQSMHAGLQKAGRTPQSLSATKQGDLEIGKYTGSMQSQMIERTESFNVSGQQLASMETGELATYVQTITAARGQFNQEQKDALKGAINEALTNATLKGKLKPKSSGLMNDLKNVL